MHHTASDTCLPQPRIVGPAQNTECSGFGWSLFYYSLTFLVTFVSNRTAPSLVFLTPEPAEAVDLWTQTTVSYQFRHDSFSQLAQNSSRTEVQLQIQLSKCQMKIYITWHHFRSPLKKPMNCRLVKRHICPSPPRRSSVYKNDRRTQHDAS